MREVPFDSHGDVSEEKLRARYDGDLANGLGNLVSRITTLVEKYLDGSFSGTSGAVLVGEALDESLVEKLVAEYKFHEALAEIFSWVAIANKLVDENKLWELGKTDIEKFAAVSLEIFDILQKAATHLLPFMPQTASKILEIVNAEKITKAEPLFPRITE